MTTVLGIDWAADMAEVFGGDIYDATFVRFGVGTYDDEHPSGPTNPTPATYTAKGRASSYKKRYVDGELIIKGDYRVMLLRGTIKTSPAAAVSDVMPNVGSTVTIPPPGKAVAELGTVVGIEAVTEAFITLQVRGSSSQT